MHARCSLLLLAAGLLLATGWDAASVSFADESDSRPAQRTDAELRAQAGDLERVVVVGPSWEDFTNRDGTGLYHETLRAVFDLYGVRVERQYVPSERAYDLVREGRADFMTCHDRAVPPLILARHPMFENRYHVFFARDRFPDWQGQQTMRGRVVAWRIGYYDIENFEVPFRVKEVKSGVSALGMVVLGRADFYVDDERFIRDSMGKSALRFDPQQFRIEPVGSRRYRPVFALSERGAKIMELYDRGMEELYRRGELQRIFERWNMPLPRYDFSAQAAGNGQ